MKIFKLIKNKLKKSKQISIAQGRPADTLLITLNKCEELKSQRNKIIEILLRESPKYQRFIESNYPDYFSNRK